MNILDRKKLNAFIAKRKPVEVSAGILSDWFWTAATIYKDGKWVRPNRAMTDSRHATPGFKATLRNGDVVEVEASRVATKSEETRLTKRHKAKHEKAMKVMRDFVAKRRAEKEAAA